MIINRVKKNRKNGFTPHHPENLSLQTQDEGNFKSKDKEKASPLGRGYTGFTLIELLVVIAILGILAAIAIPIYRVQTIKARLTEVTNSASHVASALVAYRHNAIQDGSPNIWPNCGNIADIQTSLGVGLAAVGRISAASVNQGTGVITMTVSNIDGTVNGSIITLSPSLAADSSISWKWGGTLPPRYIPKE